MGSGILLLIIARDYQSIRCVSDGLVCFFVCWVLYAYYYCWIVGGNVGPVADGH